MHGQAKGMAWVVDRRFTEVELRRILEYSHRIRWHIVPERWVAVANAQAMKKRRRQAGYDSSRGGRGKYARRYAGGTNVVVLEPDVAKVFRDSRSVNMALGALTAIARQQRRKTS